MELNGWLLAYVHKALDLFQGKKEERGGRSEGGWEEGRGGKKKAEKGRIHTAYGFNLGSYLNKKILFHTYPTNQSNSFTALEIVWKCWIKI